MSEINSTKFETKDSIKETIAELISRFSLPIQLIILNNLSTLEKMAFDEMLEKMSNYLQA